MKINPFEVLLAKLLSDRNEVELFLLDRETYALNCGLTAAERQEILAIDAPSLRFAAHSYERKRRCGDAATPAN